jgi:hypothetical protein
MWFLKRRVTAKMSLMNVQLIGRRGRMEERGRKREME